jgi:hypothetical protein
VQELKRRSWFLPAQQGFDMYGFAETVTGVYYGREWEHRGADECFPCSYFLLFGWGLSPEMNLAPLCIVGMVGR